MTLLDFFTTIRPYDFLAWSIIISAIIIFWRWHLDKDNNFDEDINRIKYISQSALPKNIPFNAIGDFESAISDDKFIQFVNQCKQYIQRGDVFQIVLSRRFQQSFTGDEFNVYRALRSMNPSP